MGTEGLGEAINTLSKAAGGFVKGRRAREEELRLDRLEEADVKKQAQMEDLQTFKMWQSLGYIPFTQDVAKVLDELPSDSASFVKLPDRMAKRVGFQTMYNLSPTAQKTLELREEAKKEAAALDFYRKKKLIDLQTSNEIEDYRASVNKSIDGFKTPKDMREHMLKYTNLHLSGWKEMSSDLGSIAKEYSDIEDKLLNPEDSLENATKFRLIALSKVGPNFAFIQPLRRLLPVELLQPFGRFRGMSRASDELLKVTADGEDVSPSQFNDLMIKKTNQVLAEYKSLLDELKVPDYEKDRLIEEFGDKYTDGFQYVYKVYSQPKVWQADKEIEKDKRKKKTSKRQTTSSMVPKRIEAQKLNKLSKSNNPLSVIVNRKRQNAN